MNYYFNLTNIIHSLSYFSEHEQLKWPKTPNLILNFNQLKAMNQKLLKKQRIKTGKGKIEFNQPKKLGLMNH